MYQVLDSTFDLVWYLVSILAPGIKYLQCSTDGVHVCIIPGTPPESHQVRRSDPCPVLFGTWYRYQVGTTVVKYCGKSEIKIKIHLAHGFESNTKLRAREGALPTA